MTRHLFYFIILGTFWGLSPSFYRMMGEALVPVSHIIVYSGLGVGIALAIGAWATSGRLEVSLPIVRYAGICALLMNVPFALSLFYARHVPTTELALIMSTAPFFSYAAALLTGRENAAPRRLMAIGAGFVSSGVLILSREGMLSGNASWWMLAAFTGPILYTAYNWYAARSWPTGADTLSIGAFESVWSSLLAVPFMLWFSPPWDSAHPPLLGYWSLAVATLIWVMERIAFFTLIRDKGATYTVQAVYVATPAAVIFAMIFFGGAGDPWIWLSLVVLMFALWLNNSQGAIRKTA